MNKCKKCDGIGKPSKGYGNAYSRPEPPGNKAIHFGCGDLVDCLKCSSCGHSWVPAGFGNPDQITEVVNILQKGEVEALFAEKISAAAERLNIGDVISVATEALISREALKKKLLHVLEESEDDEGNLLFGIKKSV